MLIPMRFCLRFWGLKALFYSAAFAFFVGVFAPTAELLIEAIFIPEGFAFFNAVILLEITIEVLGFGMLGFKLFADVV